MQKTMVIVWDVSDIKAVLKFFFTEQGYAVQTTSDVDAGYQVCIHQPPTIVIIRRSFPDNQERKLNAGLELCQRLRARPTIPRFPIVIGDAANGQKDWRVKFQEAYATGANACFGRIFDIDVVQGMINQLLDDPTLVGLSDR